MGYEISGKLLVKNEVLQVSEKFKKREFVIESERVINPTMVFTDYIKFQLTQDRVSLIEQYNEGDMIKISFDIKGNKWEKDGETKYFTNLEAWRIDGVQAEDPSFNQAAMAQNQVQQQAAAVPPGTPPPVAADDDELPF